MKTALKGLLVAGLMAVLSLSVRAEHFSGASITYECSGNNFYSVWLELYRDCSGADMTPQSLIFTSQCGITFTVNNLMPVDIQEVSPLCNNSMANSTCNGGPLPGFRRYRFRVDLFLSPCNYWTIGWSICCRNAMVNLNGTPGTYVQATLNNANIDCDNSPVFNDSGIPYICLGNDLLYSPGAFDPDGNNMVYSLVNAQFLAPPPTVVNYAQGYSGIEPVPGMTIDPNTGQLSFSPNLQGNYVVVIEVATYDANGQLIGRVMRDLMFVAVPCDGDVPVTDGLSNATAGAVITSSNSIEVCGGVPFCVDLVVTDSDLGSVITMLSNAAALLPGSTFQVNGVNPATATLCWNPDQAILPISVYIQASDGQCPIENIISTSILLTPAGLPPVPPNAGTNGFAETCVVGPNIPLFPLLGGNPQAGGLWTGPAGVSHNGTFVPGTDDFGAYTYTVGTACLSASATVTVEAGGGGNAGNDSGLLICANAAPVELINALGGTPDAGGTWAGPAGPMNGTYDPAVHDPGPYTYTIAGVGPCPGDDATVTVVESPAPNAGMDAAVTLCSTSPITDLFPLLGPGAEPDGVWTGPSAINGNYNPFLHQPGVYTYTVTSPLCGDASTTVTVTENQAVDAGANANITICTSSAPVDLFTTLNGTPQPGGVWNGPTGVMDGMYDPAVHEPGNYGYTLTGLAPCATETAFVIVTETIPPDAGTDAVVDLCDNDAPLDLFTQLGGTPDAGGNWTGPSVINGVFDPQVHQPGAYVYTLIGTAICPGGSATVTVNVAQAPDAGAEAAITICDDAGTVDLISILGGTPQPGGAWTGPDATNGNFDPLVHAPGVYTYTVAGGAACGDASATVTITVNSATNAGTDATLALCDNAAVVDLFNVLGGTPDAGGVWTGPVMNNGIFDPATHPAGAYTYTVAALDPCASSSATVTITLSASVDAGEDALVQLCSNDAQLDLLGQLGGTPQPGGIWAGPSATNGIYIPGTHIPGDYVYTIIAGAPCGSASATVTIEESTASDAGAVGAIDLCSDMAVVDLVGFLTGTPQPGGTWTGPDEIDGNFDPALHAGGVYIYTVAGAPPCPDASASVTVNLSPAVDAGIGGVFDICTDNEPVDLFTILDGTPMAGGAWQGPSAMTGIYDPVQHAPGAYTYTVEGQGACATATATIDVFEHVPVNAGLDAAIELCASAAPVDLLVQLNGTPQPGGTWSGPDAMTGVFDPALHAQGDYVYTVTGTGTCPDAAATITVVVSSVVDAGIDAAFAICANDAPVDLFTQLGGTPQPGGTWNGPSAMDGIYDPVQHMAGAYLYVLAANGACPGASAIITVAENLPVDAGTDGAITLCSNAGIVDLFSSLGGTPQGGGTWNGPSELVAGLFQPGQHLPGIYTYTVLGVDPCPHAIASVTVVVEQVNDAGTSASITICDTGGAIDLFAELGGTPQAGGEWTGPSVITGVYDPAVHIPGEYTYAFPAGDACPAASASVLIVQTGNPYAGEDAVVDICSSDDAIDMFSQLGGNPDPGGVWSGIVGEFNGIFSPSEFPAGAYTYTVEATAPCVSDQAVVTVTVHQAPDAGTDGDLLVCENSGATNLFGSLGGTPQPGGTWDGPSALDGAMFDPSVNVPGTYTYTLNAGAICGTASAAVTVTVTGTPDAGLDGAITLCETDAAVDLFTVINGTPDGGGTWSGPTPGFTGIYDPAVHAAGVYTYTIDVPPPCVSDESTVTVTVESSPDPGEDGALLVCENSAATALFNGLGGTPQAGGTWTGPSVVDAGMFDPATHAAGLYTYTVTGVACGALTATVNVTVTGTPNAGGDGDITLCASDAAVELFTQLTGTPDAGGTWSGPSPGFTGTFDPAIHTAGTYTYTIDAPPPCVSDASTVTVTVEGTPDPGEDGALLVCENSAATALFNGLDGTPQAGGTWTGPSVVDGGMFDPAIHAAGSYTYTVTGVACGALTATVSVTVTGTPNAGGDGEITLCASDAAVDLFTQLTGTPDAGGTWSGPSPGFTGTFDPAIHTAGTYTYTIDAPPPCIGDAATVMVTVIATPDAGTGGAITVCETGGAVDLFTSLGGSPQPGGTWTGPSGPFDGIFDPALHIAGDHVYQIPGTGDCPASSATISVTITGTPDAGANSTITACSSGAVVDLFQELGGAPDLGGNWSGPVPGFNGLLDPAVHPSGSYTYSIAASPPCGGAQATVTVSVEQAPDAGTSTTIDVCPGASPVDLLNALGAGAQQGGAWTGPSGPTDGMFDPSLDPAGVYFYHLSGDVCADASATVTVGLLPGANAGTGGSIDLCSTDAAVDLFTLLGGTPDQGGGWTNPINAPVSGILDPASGSSGNYTYTVSGMGPCPQAQSTIEVSISNAPQSGISGVLQLCDDAGQVSLFEGLTGTLHAGGTWTDPSSMAHSSVVDPLVDPSGTYTYTVTSGNCTPASSTVNVVIFSAPDAGMNATTTLCTSDDPVQLVSLLSGTPDPNGMWSGPAGPAEAMFAPASNPPGDYIYTVTGNAACADAQAVVTISISVAANAGAGGAIIRCANEGPVNLLTVLSGSPQPNGVWTAPNGGIFSGILDPSVHVSGTYEYVVQPAAPCPSATAQVEVEILPVPRPDITATNSDACVPVEVTISHDFEGSANCTWIIGNGEFSEDCGPVTTTISQAGTYGVTLIIDAGNGCGSTTVIIPDLIRAFDKPVAHFEALPGEVGTQFPEAYFHNYSQGASSWAWDMGGTGSYSTMHVNHTFPADLGDEYEVCLIAYASPQCADTTCSVITVNDAMNVHVPNAFTPDDDGLNDEFRPMLDGIDVERYRLEIFDRWGVMLFTTRDPNTGWDGRSSGQETPQGVYVWKLSIKDGYSGRRVERTGHVTLLR